MSFLKQRFLIKYSNLNLFLIIMILASFVVSTSGYALITVPGNSYFYLFLILPTLIFFFLYIKKKEIIYFNIYNLSFLILLFLTISSFIINGNIAYISTNIKFIIIITFAFLFTKLISFDIFVKYFIKTMIFIVLISLIGYVLINFFKIPVNLSTFVNVNGVEYYNGIVFFAIKRFAVYPTAQMHRNIGCFWEPGLFATFITIALIFEISFKDKKSLFNIFLFLLGILSTRSTFGYIMIAFILLLALSKNLKGIKGSIGIISSFILVAFTYFNFDNIINVLYSNMPILFGKIAHKSGSLTSRLETPITNLKVFFEHPLFGAGFGKADNIFSSMTEASQTSTSTYFLAAFGIFGILYSLFFIYGIMMQKTLSFPNRIIIMIIFLIIINKEPHFFINITFIIMFFFLKVSSLKYNGE